MRRVLGIADPGDALSITDPWGNVLIINDRIIQHTLINPPRTPSVAWLRFAITEAIELWEKPIETKTGTEIRRYYLGAVNEPEKRSVVAIAEGGVVFNVIDCDPPYADNLRSGNLLQTIYKDNRRYCTSHDCCDDVVSMERSLTKAQHEHMAALEEMRAAKKRLKMKNPPAKADG
jgi:hypothetical protein